MSEEKTLGKVARDAWYRVRPSCPADWQAVADAVVAAHEARRWKAIESAPKDGYILAWSPERRMAFQVIWSKHYDDWTIMCGDGVATMEFTLWTPIPAPPKEASDATS